MPLQPLLSLLVHDGWLPPKVDGIGETSYLLLAHHVDHNNYMLLFTNMPRRCCAKSWQRRNIGCRQQLFVLLNYLGVFLKRAVVLFWLCWVLQTEITQLESQLNTLTVPPIPCPI